MPFDKKRYPVNWTETRARILERDNHRCKFCGAKNYAIGHRDDDGWFFPTGGNEWHDRAGNGEVTPKEWIEIRHLDAFDSDARKYIQIILTIAHITDPNPMNCADDNLAALCQRCHNKHDMAMRQSNARKTRALRAGQVVLEFEVNA